MLRKIGYTLLCVVCGLIGVYAGTSCVATFLKASGQPTLVSGAAQSNFMGYYLVALVCGIVCLVSILLLVLLLIRRKRSSPKDTKRGRTASCHLSKKSSH